MNAFNFITPFVKRHCPNIFSLFEHFIQCILIIFTPSPISYSSQITHPPHLVVLMVCVNGT